MKPLRFPTKRRVTILAFLAGAVVLFAAASIYAYNCCYEIRITHRLARLNGRATYAQVCALVRDGAKLRYDGTDHCHPQRPEVTEARGSGDCKDMAIWFAAKLNDPSIIYVEGSFDHSSTGHAWIEWFGDGKLWLIDLTARYQEPMLVSDTRDPSSTCYYAPERYYTRYGVFAADGSILDAR